MKITVKHNGTILDEYGYDDLFIVPFMELTKEKVRKITRLIQFRETKEYDFEYGIGGSPTDEYFKIKSIRFSDNNTNIIVKVSKI